MTPAPQTVPVILTAHGSADPRSATVTHGVAEQIRLQRPGIDVRVAFCEKSSPNLRDVLADLRGPAVVTPLLLTSAYHARVDIPSIVAESEAGQRGDVLQTDTLGEDGRLVELLRRRLAEIGVESHHRDTGVVITAVGSSHASANAGTAGLGPALAKNAAWAGVRVAFATAEPSVSDAIDELRRAGVSRIALAPWFIAPGVITDRVSAVAAAADVGMAEPLGAHPLLAATVLDRVDRALGALRVA
jgi:sirohydrochlorin ferrochelatase